MKRMWRRPAVESNKELNTESRKTECHGPQRNRVPCPDIYVGLFHGGGSHTGIWNEGDTVAI